LSLSLENAVYARYQKPNLKRVVSALIHFTGEDRRLTADCIEPFRLLDPLFRDPRFFTAVFQS
jgi:hypothetical protein